MFQNKLTYNKTLTNNDASEVRQLSKGSSSYQRVEREMNSKVKDYNSIREIVLNQMEKNRMTENNAFTTSTNKKLSLKNQKKEVIMGNHQKKPTRMKK